MRRNKLRENILQSLDRILSESVTGMEDVSVVVDLDVFHTNEYPFEPSDIVVEELAMDRIRTAVHSIGGLQLKCEVSERKKLKVSFRVHNSLTERDVLAAFKTQYLPVV